MTIKNYSSKKQHILYDGDHLPQIDSQFFDSDFWQQQQRLSEPSGGRGQAFFIRHPNGCDYLLRHYRRGGLVAKVSQDCYWYTGLEQSRPWQEFKLTLELFQAGLPVAQPIAARVVRSGLCYRGDLVTLRLPDAKPFTSYLQQPGHELVWHAVGQMIARFHRWGLNHVDLNANNILIDAAGKPWLIDFDRCLKMPATADPQWQEANLQRLQRSIRKLNQTEQLPEQWQRLHSGYLTP